MQRRNIGTDQDISAIGLGCMGMSEFYGPRDDSMSLRVLEKAAEMGINLFDTADMYGPWHNETLLGRFLQTRRSHIRLATKFGIVRNPGEYQRTLNNSPAYARQSCEASLRRLGVEQIDLYYVHRLDPQHPVEETMAGLASLVQEGKLPGLACVKSAPRLCVGFTRYTLWRRYRPSTLCGAAKLKLTYYPPAASWASAWWLTPRWGGAF